MREQNHQARRTAPQRGSPHHRYEIFQLGPRRGRSRARLIATAESREDAKRAVRAIHQNTGTDEIWLEIRHAADSRWLLH